MVGRSTAALLALCVLLLACGDLVRHALADSTALDAAATTAHSRRLQGSRWTSRRFNYQIGQPFNISQHVLPGVDVYFIDAFDNDAATVAAMVSSDLLPVCYFSAGIWDSGRPDAGSFDLATMGNWVAGVNGQRWLDIRQDSVRDIMFKRIRMCKDKGFLAVDPGSTDGYLYETGIGLTRAELKAYVLWLADIAHMAGLDIGLLNSVGLVDGALVNSFEFAINTACYALNECQLYAPFMEASKPVFHLEYLPTPQFSASVCPLQDTFGLISVKKDPTLAAFPYIVCPPSSNPASLIGGSPMLLAVVQLAVTGGALNLVTPSAAIAGPLPAAKPVRMNGTLTISGTDGLGLIIGPGDFDIARRIDWAFNAASSTFSALVDISGTFVVVKYAGGGNINTSQQQSITCSVSGRLQMTSQVYPGPGLNGRYEWLGNLTLTPNPWVYWATQPSNVTRRSTRRLLSGSGNLGSSSTCTLGSSSSAIDSSSSSAAAVQHGARQLQASVNRAPVAVPVEGDMSSSEAPGSYPSVAQDKARADNSSWLDAKGDIRIVGTVPTNVTPEWKLNPPHQYNLPIPWWLLWLLVAIGAVLLLLAAAALVLFIRRRKAQDAATEDTKEVAGDQKQMLPGMAIAFGGSRRLSAATARQSRDGAGIFQV